MPSSPFILGSEVEPGRYICLRTASVFGRLIKFWTRSQYDHVIIAIGNDECIEATSHGVVRSPLSKYRGALAVANTAEQMSDDQRATVVAAVSSYVGDEYAWPAIVAIGLRKAGLKWAWILKATADKDAVFCSELACLGGLAAGLRGWLCSEPSPACVDPAEMAVRPGMRRVTIT